MTHATEGDLMRWLDGETDAAEGAAFEAHSATCADCGTRLNLLRRQDAAWRRAVVVLDEVVPRPRRRFTRLAWAAGLLVLLGIGVTPARAWIVSWSRTLWGVVAERPERDVVVPAPVAAPVSRVQFVPARGPFTIEVPRWQAGGQLVLDAAAGEAAVAWVEGAVDDADLVVLPTGLRIANRAAATASYYVQIPPSVTAVLVEVGGRASRVRMPARISLGRIAGADSLSGQEEHP